MFRFNQTTSYVPLKPLRETNGVHSSLYDILSDCYREVGPVSTVKRKTLWNVAANAAWQLVSFMVWDRTQKKLQTIPCFNPLLLFCLPALPLTSAPILFLYLIFPLHQKNWCLFWIRVNPRSPYITHRKTSFPPQTSPICSPYSV